MTACSKSRTFSLGKIFITPGAEETLDAIAIHNALERHQKGDWGDCCPSDAEENEFALGKYLRIFSVYHDEKGTKFWVITEADRSATTLLLPEEY